ncbi:TIGR04423 family type III CRISPR-associated protein [Sulfurimonas sp. SAG-AH-194-C21]|nr:TIGR04423 family type III CRISPR-associated protein [Sulfurimonas sp. SAG-AH-194-C21]MDF1884325.1 TIGR04423 family type III CRISPR-associated protein [Sulfurimonas sp. SAG-AH-194-C21]
MKNNKQEIETYINSLKGYEGYVQFSDRPIEDIWTQKSDINVNAKDGFVYEAHFCNGTESISIKQINDSWFVSTTDISNISDEDTQVYHAFEKNVKMAQIWGEVADEFCEGMKVQKIKKVVFVGFIKGDSK